MMMQINENLVWVTVKRTDGIGPWCVHNEDLDKWICVFARTEKRAIAKFRRRYRRVYHKLSTERIQINVGDKK